MKAKTRSEWEEYYKARTGCEDLNLQPQELIFYQPEHGFVSFIIGDDYLLLRHVCGDGKYWARFVKNVMRFEKVNKLRSYTQRTPEAWIRKYGGHVIGYEMECDIDELKV